MLASARDEGARAAREKFGFEMPTLGGVARGAKEMLVGQPGRAFVEGPGAFRPGGMLSRQSVWWPSTQGLRGMQKVMPWAQRAGTMMIPFQIASSMHGNPNDGTLANVLGTAGSIAGQMYGFPAGGLIGGTALGALGASAGRGIGHLLGSRAPQPYPQGPPP